MGEIREDGEQCSRTFGRMDRGTDVDVGVLCAAISKTRMIRMVVHYLDEKLKEKYPGKSEFTSENYIESFNEHIPEITDIIKKRYPTVERRTDCCINQYLREHPS
jgi:hypothetical protein